MPTRTFRLTFALALVAVFVLSLWPKSAPPPPSFGWDKLDHVVAYAVLGLLGVLSWPRGAALILSALFIYGGVIELLQGWVGYRHADWADLVADGIGLVSAYLIVRLWGFHGNWPK